MYKSTTQPRRKIKMKNKEFNISSDQTETVKDQTEKAELDFNQSVANAGYTKQIAKKILKLYKTR